MKHTKHYTAVATAAFIMTLAGCKRMHHPVGKIVYATIESTPATGTILNLGDEQSLTLVPDEFISKNNRPYRVGDTIWFYYDKYAQEIGDVFVSNVITNLGRSTKDSIIREQNKIFHTKSR